MDKCFYIIHTLPTHSHLAHITICVEKKEIGFSDCLKSHTQSLQFQPYHKLTQNTLGRKNPKTSYGQNDNGYLQTLISTLSHTLLHQTQNPKSPNFPPKIIKTQLISLSSSTLKSFSLLAATSLTITPPSFAEEIEKAALFDFNLTLPIIMAEFLFLMFALDKIWFSPLGKFMDQRDAAIKEKLGSVKDTSEEVKQLEEQAAAIMKASRAEIAAALNKMKKETQIEVEQKLAEGRKKVEAELQEALANLEQQKEDTIKSLDSQIAALSENIVRKVLPIN